MSNEDLSGLNGANDVETNEEMIAESQGDAAQANAPVMIRADAIRVQPDANGVVVLPAEVALGDIQVVGTDLVISMPDGSQWVIVDGAIFVPQLVIGDVEVPPANLAALLIGEEPEPAAGNNQSSGGNFSVAVPDLGPPHPLGDLLPPTALDYTPPTVEPLGFILEEEDDDNIPDIGIFPDDPDNPGNPGNPGAPGSDAASSTVQESGLPARGDEPAGSNSAANSETTTGTIVYVSPDGPSTVSINGVEITNVGQQIQGAYGTLTITSITDGAIGYSYTLNDNTSGNNTTDFFSVTVTDADGDTATATLTIDIVDDVPVARADTDTILSGEYGPEEGNVISGSGTTSGSAGADTEGADGAQVVGVSGAGSAVADFTGSTVVQGLYGTLTINSDGSYSYVRDANSPGGVDDVFEYTLEDGDGDTSSATLTISIGDAGNTITITPDPDSSVPGASGGTRVFEAGLPPRGGEPAGSGESADGDPNNNSDMSETATGTINWTDGDGVNVVRIDGVIVTGAGQSIPIEGGTLTIVTYDPDANVLTYRYTLADNTSGDNTSISFDVSITDADGDTATDSITIDIVDDVPIANNDSDSVAAGTYGPETGNVITGEGTNEGLGGSGADVQGADGASVTFVVGTGDRTMVDADGESVQGQYGVLTIQSDGSYSYVRDAGTPGGVTDVFTYTLTDGDGDSVTATLTFEVGDNGVVVGANALVRVDDDALLGGNPGGVGDDVDGANLAGILSGSGADAPISFDFSASGAPAGFTYVESGSDILIQQGGVTVITVTLNAATGAYTVTQNAPIDHAPGGNENNVIFNIGYTVTDVDGDSAMGVLTINADDDTPVVGSAEVAVPDLMVDETNLSSDDSADMSGLFTVSAGADGLGSLTYALSLSVQGADSGLVDTATGQSILLYNNGAGTVEGRVGGSGGAVAFVVSVDASGTVTLDQQRAIVHPDSPNNYDETVTVDGGVLSLTATVTDGDGDSASQSVDIGGALNFDDDGPSASVTEGFQAPSLAVDETNLGVDDTGNAYAGAFNLSGGADGTQSVVYSFTITQGANSGLMTTGGTAIFLYTDAQGNVEGRVGGEGGAVAFEVRVDAGGNVTLDQILSLKHPNVNSDNEAVSPTAGSIQLTATITDGDGDKASSSIDLSGNISFSDDGPTIGRAEVSVPVLTVDETDLGISDSSTGFAALFNSSYGADGAGSLAYSLTLSSQGVDSGLDTTDGTSIFLFNNGDGTVEGRVGGALGATAFVVSVNGSGQVTLIQLLSLSHPDDANPDDQVDIADGVLSLTATITDGDGDSASQSVDIGGNLNFDDDGPDVTLTEGFNRPALAVDETNLNVDDDGNSYAGAFQFDAGADGQQSIAYDFVITEGADSGLDDTATGQSIYLYYDGSDVVGRVGSGGAADSNGAIAFRIEVDGNGDVSLDQLRALIHPNPNADNETVSPIATSIQLRATLTDGDGDTDSATINIGGNITFADDVPTIGRSEVAVPDLTVDETNLGVSDSDSGFANLFTSSYGADGAGSLVYSLTLSSQGVDSGLDTTDGTSIFLYNNGAGVVEGRVGGELGATAFVVSVNGSGQVTLTQLLSLYHPDDTDPNDQVDIADGVISLKATITDGDNDSKSATVDLGSHLNFNDDGPDVGTGEFTAPALAVDETNLGVDDDGNAYAGAFTLTPGADGQKSVVYSFTITEGADSGLDDTATGQSIYLYYDGNDVVGRVGSGGAADSNGAISFRIEVDGSGNVNLDQVRAMVHPNPNADNETVSPTTGSIQLTATLTDGDDDVDSESIDISGNITFADDAPSVGTDNEFVAPSLAVDETNLGVDDDGNAYAGAFTFSAGADGEQSRSYALTITEGTDSGLDDTATGQSIYLYYDGNDVVGRVGSGGSADSNGAIAFRIEVDGSGNVSLDQVRAMVHPNPNADNETVSPTAGTIQLTATLVDRDGDDDSATIDLSGNITFADDVPSIGRTQVAVPDLTVDESDLSVDDDGNAFAGLFTSSFGADGAGSVSYSLTLSVQGVDSGLDTTAGTSIFLYNNGAGTVEGRVGGENGAVAFTVTVDGSGNVSLDQILSLHHPDDTNPNDQVDIAENVLSLKATVTDGDGDSKSASVDLGSHLNFDDDGPSIDLTLGNEAGVTVQTSDANITDSATSNFSLLSVINATTFDAGADGLKSDVDSWSVTVTGYNGVNGVDSGIDTAAGQSVYLYQVGTTVIGSTQALFANVTQANWAFTIVVNNGDTASEGNVFLNQYMALDHSSQEPIVLGNNLVNVTYTRTITDGDDDTASDSVTIDLGGNVSFLDDAPTVDYNGNFNGALTLDETRPEGTDNGGPNGSTGDMSETTVANAVSASFTVDLGNDLPGTVTYSLQLTLDNGSSQIGSGLYALDTSDKNTTDTDGYGQGAEIVLVNDGGVIKGVVGGDLANPYFTISINGSGDVTFTQLRNIYHGNPASNDDVEALITDGGALSIVATAEDADGDTASDSIDVSGGFFRIEDDGPTAFDPEDAPGIQNDASGGFTGDLDINAAISAYLGTDGGTVRFPATLDGTDSGMNSNGVDIIWNVSADGQTLTGMAGANLILTITLDQDASTYELDMNGSVDAFTDFTFTDQNADFIGGANAWFGIVADVGSSDVLITPNNGSKVNTSDFVGGVDDGNSLKPGEFIQLDYVTNLAGSPRSSGYNQVGATHTFDGHYKTNGGTVLFVKSGSNNQTSTIKVAAFDDADANGNNVRDGGDRTADPITSIIISYDGVSSGPITVDGVYNVNGREYTVDFNGGTVDVTGKLSGTGANSPGTSIAAFTDTGYNSLVFSHVAGTDVKFGGFGAQIPSTDPVDFSVPIQIVDGDGDIVFGDDMDFSLVASGGATTMAFEKIALGDGLQAANDEFALFDSDARALAMSSAIAIGFGAQLPAKFAWLFGDEGGRVTAESDFAAHQPMAFDRMPIMGDDVRVDALSGLAEANDHGVAAQSNLVIAKDSIDVSFIEAEAAGQQVSDLPQDAIAHVAIAEQIAIDAGDVVMPDAAALAAMVAAKGEGADLAVVAKEAIVDGGEGEGSVDALIAAATGNGGHDAVQALMVVGQESFDFGGHMPANVDAILTDAMLLADHAIAPAVNG